MSENILDGYRLNAKKTETIIEKIKNVEEISKKNEESIQTVTDASSKLNSATEELNTQLEVFKV